MSDEKVFLSAYRQDDYPRPSVTADIVAFMVRAEDSGNYRRDSRTKLSLLLIRRGGHPFKDCWALPGGFLNPDETIEQCALREVQEETAVKPASLLSVGLFSEPNRDPRGWIISNAFVSIISEEKVRQQSGDDASDAEWFDVDFTQEDDGGYMLTLTYRNVTLRAVLTTFRPVLKRMSSGERRKACADIAARMRRTRKAGDGGIYSALASARKPAAAANLAGLGKRIMAARNVNYRQ